MCRYWTGDRVDADWKHCATLRAVKVRAIAIASPRSNVIGAVELTTSPEGLSVLYLDAAHVGGDGVPVPLAPRSESVLAWEKVIDAKVVGDAVLLQLAVGPSIEQRLLLVRFTFGHDRTPHELRQRRILIRVVALAVALLLLVIALLLGPRIAPDAGPLFGIGLGVLLAAVTTVAGLVSDRFLVTGGHTSALVREIFVGELLATLPRLPREPNASLRPKTTFKLPPLDGILPRTTAAVTITLAGALLAATVMAKWVFWGNHREVRTAPPTENIAYASPREAREEPKAIAPVSAEPAVATPPAPSAPATATPPPATANALTVLGPCTCARADSPLFREPLPRLSPLVLSSRRVPHKNHEDIELELAVINNSDRPLGNISLLVEFFEADQGNVTRLTSVESRTVYFEGPLASGKAIKWHVEERGTTFKIHPPTSNGLLVDEPIGPLGEGAASASAFADLLTANNRPVRLHGAMMLAYLGDRRARPAIVELGEALRDSESPYLRRILEATQDQIACQIRFDGSPPKSFKACIFNQGASAVAQTEVAVRWLDAEISPKDPVGAAPQILAERTAALSTKLEPKTGVLVEGPLDGLELPVRVPSFEVVASGHP
ncbi:MAG: hypothetical protein QM784_19835 [Polyangiaceae bacterium]